MWLAFSIRLKIVSSSPDTALSNWDRASVRTQQKVHIFQDVNRNSDLIRETFKNDNMNWWNVKFKRRLTEINLLNLLVDIHEFFLKSHCVHSTKIILWCSLFLYKKIDDILSILLIGGNWKACNNYAEELFSRTHE